MSIVALLPASAGVTLHAPQSALTGLYVMTFHGCDTAIADCSDPLNQQVYMAQSSDGASWTMLPGWTPFAGGVPDVVQRGKVLYIYATRRQVARYHLDKNLLETPVTVNLSGLSSGYVDPSPIVDEQNRLVLFFLRGQGTGDPAQCPPDQTTCVKQFGSATEVAGSDGTQFALDTGDRATVTVSASGSIRSASDPAVFYDGSKFVLYISYGPSISVWDSSTMKGSYSLVQSLPSGLLNMNSGGVPSGYFDRKSQMYWTFAHTQKDGVSVIRRAVHSDFSKQLTESDWKTILTGTGVGLTSTTNVESPGFKALGSNAFPPSVDISLSKSTYTTNDTITATEFRVRQPAVSPAYIRLRVWLVVPTVGEIALIDIGSDGNFLMPGGLDVNIGPVSLVTITSAFPPRGSWEFNSRVTDPFTETLVSEDLNPFTVQ